MLTIGVDRRRRCASKTMREFRPIRVRISESPMKQAAADKFSLDGQLRASLCRRVALTALEDHLLTAFSAYQHMKILLRSILISAPFFVFPRWTEQTEICYRRSSYLEACREVKGGVQGSGQRDREGRKGETRKSGEVSRERRRISH